MRMKLKTWKQSGAVLAAAVVLMGASLVAPRMVAADDESGHSDSAEKGLVGVWRVTVTPYDCATGTPITTLESMLTFARGGTLSGTTSGLLYAPGQRTPDHGVWGRREDRGYRAVSEAYILFDSPAGSPAPLRRSSQRITQDITFDEDQPDTFTSRARLQFIGIGGGRPVLATGCAKAVARRFE
jgi:hypothetical protein